MGFTTWFLRPQGISKRFRVAGASRRPPCSRAKPTLEMLELRTLLSTLKVLNNADSGPGSLRNTIAAAASGDTITFSSAVSGQTIALTSGELAVSESLNIVGLGAANLTISGSGASRVFAIGSGATVSISRLTIADGFADQGGGIDNAGTLTIRDAIFSGDQVLGDSAATGIGGGILNEPGATLSVAQTAFLNNQAVGGAAGRGFGGGLMNQGTATVTGATFTNNTAIGGANFLGVGGGIANRNGGTLTVESSTFMGNQALDGLGGVAGGGAINNRNSSLTVDNSVFLNNEALAPSTFSLGGAILTVLSTLNVTHCTFAQNLSSGLVFGESGAIDSESDSADTIVGSTFTDNLAIATGTGSGSTGGAVSNISSTISFKQCTFTGNQCIGGDGADGVNTFGQGAGGAILNDAGSLSLTGCSLTGNVARGGNNNDNSSAPALNSAAAGSAFGGAIFNFPTAMLTIGYTVLANNQAIAGNSAIGPGPQAAGGGIDSDVNSSLVVTSSAFIGNLVQGGAGAAGFQGGFAIGGALSNQFSSTATLTNTLLAGNQAIGGTGGSGAVGGDGIGGGIMNAHPFGFDTLTDSASLTLTNSILAGNLAQGGSGGAGANGGDGLGGGILQGRLDAPSPPSMTIVGSVIAGNQAVGGTGGVGGNGGQGLGGGIYVAGGTACIRNTNIVANQAIGGAAASGGSAGQGIGGGVYIATGSTVGVVHSRILGNHASTSNDDVFGVFSPTC